MRKWLSLLLMMGLIATILAACGQPAPTPTVAPREAPKATVPPAKATTAPPKATTPTPSKPAATKPPAPARPPAGDDYYYSGKTIEIILATGAGGGTDSTGRAVAAFLPKYIPGNPRVIVRNQPGAAGVIAGNSFQEKAKPDGLTLLHGSSSMVSSQQRQMDILKFDLLKMPAVGNIGGAGGLIGVRKGIMKRLTDPRAEPVVMATRGGEETANLIPLFGREFLGWNVRWLTGFSGTGETLLAVRRGEVDMFLDGGVNLRALVKEGIAESVAQLGTYKGGKFSRRSDFTDVPTLEEILGDKKPSGTPWQGFKAAYMPQTVYKFTVAPPGTPANIMKTLTDAYAKMNADPKFHELLGKVFGEVYDVSVGKETEELMKESLDVPREAIDYVESLTRKFGITK